MKITGDRVAFGEAALIICNHRTRVDWMFLWCLCLRHGQLSGLKIVLKESLKGIPGFGWATQVNAAAVTGNSVVSPQVDGARQSVVRMYHESVVCMYHEAVHSVSWLLIQNSPWWVEYGYK